MINTSNLAFDYNKKFDEYQIRKDFIINPKLDISVLEDKYRKDTWDIHNWNEYNEWIKNEKQRTIKNIHFEYIDNINVRTEIKIFMANAVLSRKGICIGTIRKYSDTFKKLNNFINSLPFELNSLLEIETYKIINMIKKQTTKGIYGLEIFLNQYYDFYKKQYRLIPKFNKDDDIWNLDVIGFPINCVETTPIHTLDFTSITICDLKIACKKLAYHFLPKKSVSSVKRYRIAFTYLNNYLLDNTEIILLKDITREVFEDFLADLKERTSATFFNNILSSLKVCFDTLKLLNYSMPNEQLIYDFDCTKLIRKETVKVLSDNELRNINVNINKMHPIYRNILFVFEQTGTRISETLTLKNNYLIQRKNENGEILYSLKYMQHKTKKMNCIPIDEITAQVIIHQIEINKTEFGEDCEYIFTTNGKTPVIYKTFRDHYKKLIFENNILSDDGTLLSSKLHIFRATRATNLANRGISYDTIRLILGHANMNSLYHYIKIHSSTMSDMLKPIFDEMTYNYEHRNNELKIKVSKKNNEMLQNSPLVNGMCCKNPLEGCEYSNICYTCDFFKGNKKYLQIYENQLENAKSSLEMAKLNNFTRIIEQNETLINGLERIIKEIKES